MSSERIKFICATCGSDDITCSANVKWSVEKQEWVIAGVPLDDDFCEACEEECSLEEVLA